MRFCYCCLQYRQRVVYNALATGIHIIDREKLT